MAEEIVLVGQFRDEITPKLKKLNKELNKVTKNFTKLGAKLKPITADMKKLANESERVADALKAQKAAVDSNTRSWSAYRTAVGKAGAAQRKAFKGTQTGGRGPRNAPRTTRGSGAGGVGASAVGGAVFGAGIGNILTNAIVSGFQMGVGLMMKPFMAFGGAFAERVGDEMADIQSAGGMFAIDQKSKEGDRLFKNFGQAREAQEDLNRSLAASAAALPGATNDYVRAARGLTDTVMGAFQKDREAFAGLAKELGAGEGASAQENLTKVLTKFTEQTVLLGLGGSKGGMPLTMLMEQLVTQEQVNVKGMKMRYAQLRQNPLLANVLEEAQAEINATAAGTADRFRVMIKSLQRALPEEVVNSMRMSMSGIMESIRSAFLDPDTGLLGLGRELKVAVPKINEFGQYVDAQGKVVKTAAEAMKDNTTVFKIIRETLGGFLVPLSELAGFLPELFDPLQGIAEAFVDLREQSIMVLQKFTAYTNWFKSQEFPDAPQRGALAAFNKLLLSIGAIDKDEALSTAKLLETKGSDLGSIAKDILSKLFSSDFMKDVGFALGNAVGSILSSMAAVLSGANDMASAGPFAQGLKQGFDAASGGDAIKTIFTSIIDLIGKGIVEIFKAAPFEATLVTGLLLFGPAIAGAIGTAILGMIPKLFGRAAKTGGAVTRRGLARAPGRARIATAKMAGNAGKRAAAIPGLAQSGRAATRLTGGLGPGVAGAASKMLRGGKAKAIGPLAAGIVTLSTKAPQLAKAGKALTAVGKRIPMLGVAFAGADFAMRKAEGEDTATAAGGSIGGLAGGVVGAAIGTAIAPGIGTAIGGVLGSLVGDWLGTRLPGMLAAAGTFFTQTIPAWWNGMIAALPGLLKAAWDGLVRFMTVDVPYALGSAIRAVGLFITQTIPQLWNSYWEWWKGNVKAALEMVWNFIKSLPGLMAAAWNGFVNWLVNLPSNMQTMVNDFIAWAQTLPGKIMDGLKNMGGGIVGGFKSWAQNFLSGLSGGEKVDGRASGGPVNAGQTYMVGEKGPELFTPDTSGMIIPNNKLAMGGSGGVGVTVGAINISGVNDPQAIANQVADEILVAIRRASYSELNLT